MRDGKIGFGLAGLGMGGATHARQIAKITMQLCSPLMCANHTHRCICQQVEFVVACKQF